MIRSCPFLVGQLHAAASGLGEDVDANLSRIIGEQESWAVLCGAQLNPNRPLLIEESEDHFAI